MKSKSVSPKSDAVVAAASNGSVDSVRPELAASRNTQTQPENPQKTQSSIPIALAQFNELPDCGYVRAPVVLALFGCSRATLWRWTKSSRIPSPIKLGLRISAWNVGQLRSCLNNLQTSGQADSIEGGK